MQVYSIGKDNAKRLIETEWWIGMAARDILTIQTFIREVCGKYGYSDLAKWMSECLGEEVTEFLLCANYRLYAKRLFRDKQYTFDEILAFLPEKSRNVLIESEFSQQFNQEF